MQHCQLTEYRHHRGRTAQLHCSVLWHRRQLTLPAAVRTPPLLRAGPVCVHALGAAVQLFAFTPWAMLCCCLHLSRCCCCHCCSPAVPLHTTEMRVDWAQTWSRLLAPGGQLLTMVYPVDPSLGEGPPWPVTPELYKQLLPPAGGTVTRCQLTSLQEALWSRSWV